MNFNDLPVNTLVGADWKTFKAICQSQNVTADKRTKFLLTKFVCRLLNPLTSLQERKYSRLLADKPLEHDPVFILGHWRSGTTFVHNILAQDKHFGYTTTYQTVFPHFIMAMQGIFKPLFGMFMPHKRPTDNMELSPDQPQEEEFALSNMCPYNFYNFWFFPDRMQEFCDRFLTFRRISEDERRVFRQTLYRLVKISLWNTGGTQYLSKNPPHTGRIATLAECFPRARYIYLIRNPYTVFESTRSFFLNTIKPLQLNSISEEQMEQNILRGYMELYRAYEEQKQILAADALYEVRFEDIERDALGITEDIYKKLGIPGWEEAKPLIEKYIVSKKGYKKNRYQYEPRTIQLVNNHWGEVLDKWGYQRL